MKFASSSYAGSSVDDDPSERDANSQTPNRKQPQHIGMFGRSHASQGHDQDSPFSAASKLRITTRPTSNNSSRHHSPRSDRAESKVPRKGESFDFDNAPDDDEQTPLMGGSLRTPRTRGSRRPVSSGLRQQMEYYDDPRRSCLGRLAGGMVMFVMVVLTLLGVSGFFFATTKPMSDVHIQQIQNVLASEAEIMLDLKVEAVNTNFGGIAVTSVDLNIFAKSRHVGDPKHHNHTKDPHDVSAWRRHRPQRIGIRDDDPSDPQPGDGDGLDGDPQTMLLGRILHLDSALIFEGSPLRHLAHNATGELRLEKPGSKTDDDGRERWEHVVQHPFELIVRGVLKYQLPLNSRILTASVGAGVLVHPEDSDAKGAMRVEPVPRWFIWKDLQEVTPADAEAAND
ncbi:hypothetical protein FH972_023075 [Carpinus fangiana]|uniref:Uncharacterized protein n=1 Tax=Carpinus fangiana TaxID=176857 RepID=A0A5N6KUL8_9ROSI|nr:hypothetical protein FH972_023075 [Carpinus fangiana]